MVIETTIADLGGTPPRGAVFIDRREQQIPAICLLYAVDQKIATPDGVTLDHHFDYVELDQGGQVHVTVGPPYLDYETPTPDEADLMIGHILADAWMTEADATAVKRWAYREGLSPRRQELEARLRVQAGRVRGQVHQRLTAEINHACAEYNRAYDQEQTGTLKGKRPGEWPRDAQDFEAASPGGRPNWITPPTWSNYRPPSGPPH